MPEDNKQPEPTPGIARANAFYEKPAPADEPEIPEATNLVAGIDGDGDSDNDEVEVAGSEVDNEEPGEASTPQAAEAGDEVRSLSELLETLGVEEEWFENLEVERKINGEMVSFRLGDILAGSDKFAAADNYLSEAKRKSKELLEEATNQKNMLGENVIVLTKLIETAEHQLRERISGTNWAKLRDEDPAEYAARKADAQAEEDKLNALKAQARDTYKTALQQAKDMTDNALRARLPEQRKILYEKLPDWQKDLPKAEKEAAAVFGYLRDQGYNEDKIKLVVHDGADLSMVVKAMRYDKLSKKAQLAGKQTRDVPRILRPSTDKPGKPNANGKQRDRAEILYG